MSWPSTDFEAAVESELNALRSVARIAKRISLTAKNTDMAHASVPSQFVRDLREALDALPEDEST